MTPPLDQRLVRASFDGAVDSYSSASALQTEVGVRLGERLQWLALDPSVVVDLGCGPGRDCATLAQRYSKARILAMDAAGALLASCPSKLGWRRPLHRICADARSLPLPDRSVDLIWSNLMLQWIDEPLDAFSEWARVLRPGGAVLFTSFGPDTLTELRQSWQFVDEGAHVNRFIDMHDLGDALLRAGLQEPVMDMEHLTLDYPDPWQLMRELKAMGAHNVAVERRRSLTGKRRLMRMCSHYQANFADDQGRIPATWEVVYGVAWGAAEGQARRDAGGQIATFSVDQLRGSRRGGGQ